MGSVRAPTSSVSVSLIVWLAVRNVTVETSYGKILLTLFLYTITTRRSLSVRVKKSRGGPSADGWGETKV